MASIKNFQVNRNKNTSNHNMFSRGKNNRKANNKSEKLMSGIALWASWYRYRMDKFCEDYFGIKLKLFQIFLLYGMQHNHYFMYLASRGQGKSFITAIFLCCRCALYPNTICIVASGTKGQSISVLKKIEELRANSPNLDREIKDLRLGSNDPYCSFHNGSVIRVVTSNDNARSARAHCIAVDEFRMVDLQVISKVLRKFLTTPRQAPFMQLPEYADYPPERNKEIYLSSCWYKSHWSYERATTYFKAMAEGKKYFICALPYQLPIKENLLMKQQVMDEMSEADFDAIGWKMEMEALWHGESEKAFFNFEDLSKARKQTKALYPPEVSELVNDKKLLPEKERGELRVLSIDIATMSGNQNDATSIFVTRLIPTKTDYEVILGHSESMDGALVPEQALRVNRLKKHFDIDYIIIDTQNAGIGVYDILAQGMTDPDTGDEYEPLSCINDDRMAERCVYPSAPKIIYSMRANGQINSDIAQLTKRMIKNNKVKLLIHEKESDDYLENIKGYNSLPDELKFKFKLPYIQTTMLINEMINLEAEFNDLGAVKLKEQRSARKDRYSSFSYLLFMVDYLNRKNRRQSKQDFNPSQLFLVKKGARY